MRRAEILAAARRLMEMNPGRRFSMRRLASELGVVPTAIYRHFESKEVLLAEVREEARREFGALLHESLSAPTPLARFEAALDAYLRFVTDYPDHYAALFLTPRNEGRFPNQFQHRRPSTFQFLVDRVEECMRAGVFHGHDSLAIAMACWSHVHGYAALFLCGFFSFGPEEFKRMVRDSFALLRKGIGSPGDAG